MVLTATKVADEREEMMRLENRLSAKDIGNCSEGLTIVVRSGIAAFCLAKYVADSIPLHKQSRAI